MPVLFVLALLTASGIHAQSGGTTQNLAQGKTASQSSTYPLPTAVAGSAVDGNTNGNCSGGSVTHTNQNANAWWQVDLGASATVNSIVIWNRTDCCADRLGDYWVFVSNTPFGPADTPATLQGRAGTWSSHQTVAPNPSTTIATGGGVQGRYVRVQLTGTNYLSLAEVQVMGTIASPGSNLAQGKTASQSSTYPLPTAVAGNAVDGNTNGNCSGGSVTHTNQNANAWWQVDLGASATVNSLVVWNRTDCCGSRLGDYWVFVSDTPFGSTDTPTTLQSRAGTWSSHQTAAPNPSTTITTGGGVRGRYVRVQLTGTDYLSLAEVQVMGGFNTTPAGPVTFAVTNLGTLPGGNFTSALGLSSSGLVTGYGNTSSGDTHAFVWNAGIRSEIGPAGSVVAFGNGINSSSYAAGHVLAADLSTFRAFVQDGSGLVSIPTLGGGSNSATGINEAGTVVGYSENSKGVDQPFRYFAGTVTRVGSLPEGSAGQANAINAAGQIAGWWETSTGDRHAFLYTSVVWTDINVPSGFAASEATAVADSGTVAGILTTATFTRQAFLWTVGGGIVPLGTLGGDSAAFGVNSSNMVVGTSNGAAFLYTSSHLYDLNTLLDSSGAGWQLLEARGINDRGQIAGTGLLNGEIRAFLLNPVSQPNVR